MHAWNQNQHGIKHKHNLSYQIKSYLMHETSSLKRMCVFAITAKLLQYDFIILL